MKPNKDPKQEEAELMKKWEESVKVEHEKLSATHSKKEFTLTATEKRQLVKIYTIQTLARQLIDDKINNDVLPRIGVQPTPEHKILYDLALGRFVLWTPKTQEN